MKKPITLLVPALLLVSIITYGQSLGSNAAAYNYPYDTLLKMGLESVSSGKQLGVKAPTMGMMFYNRAIEINKDRPEAYQYKGDGYLDYNLLNEALESYNSCLEVSPQNADCLFGVFHVSFLGTKKYKTEDVPKPVMSQVYNSATAFLAVATEDMKGEKNDAKNLGFLYKLGLDNRDLFLKYSANNVAGPTEENIKALEEILLPVQATKNARIVAAIYDKLVVYYSGRDNAKVKDHGNKAIATGEARITTYYYLAKTLYEQDKNVLEAEKICNAGLKVQFYAAIMEFKDNMFNAEGKKAYVAKDYPKVILNLQKLVMTNENDLAYLGFANYNLKKYPEAAKKLKELKSSAAPETVKIYYPNLDALIAFAEKPVGVAPVAQNTLLEVEKQQEIINKGIDLYYEKKYDEAVTTLNTALVYFEQTKNPMKLSVIYSNLGYVSHSQKDHIKAKEFYNKAIAAGGDAINSYANLGLITYGIEKNYTEAEKILREGIAKYPDGKEISKRFAQMYMWRADDAFDKKEYSEAIGDYLKVISIEETAEVYTFLGFAYYYTKQDAKCLEALENAKYMDAGITTKYPDIDKLIAALK